MGARPQRLLLPMLLLIIPGASSLHVVFGAHNIPHPEKAGKGGEDAFFFDDRLGIFGIADGVGGSARNGIDPGLFSREVLRRCHMSALHLIPTRAAFPGPTLVDALQIASEAPLPMGGSTTLVLGQLEASTQTLRLLNLGDSGALVLRPSMREFGPDKAEVLFPRCVLRSQDQNKGFNYPFQASAKNFRSVNKELDELTTRVRVGDIVIAATDGVLDNLFDLELQACVSEQMRVLSGADPVAAQNSVNLLAVSIAKRAMAIGMRKNDPAVKTPFTVAAAEEGKPFQGGKIDDVTIVCGVVREGARPGLRLRHNFDGPEDGAVWPPGPEGLVVPTGHVPSVQPRFHLQMPPQMYSPMTMQPQMFPQMQPPPIVSQMQPPMQQQMLPPMQHPQMQMPVQQPMQMQPQPQMQPQMQQLQQMQQMQPQMQPTQMRGRVIPFAQPGAAAQATGPHTRWVLSAQVGGAAYDSSGRTTRPYTIGAGEEQVLGRYDMASQNPYVSRQQCIVRTATNGTATLVSIGKKPTGWRASAGDAWLWLEKDDSRLVTHGSQVSLDVQNPEGVIFSVEQEGLMQPQQHGYGAPPAFATAQLNSAERTSLYDAPASRAYAVERGYGARYLQG
jgi:protein phosphatase PTC7